MRYLFMTWGILCLALPVSSVFAETVPERLLWDHMPIPIVLPVDGERVVRFPASNVRVGVPEDLPLQTMSVNGVVYWQAHGSFPATRVIVQSLEEGGGHFLLDLSASDQGVETPIVIMEQQEESDGSDRAANVAPPAHQNLEYATLIRFAAQHMYAPQRLRPSLSQVRRVPLNLDVLPLIRGAAVEAKPLVSWRHGGLYVTAIRLKNTSSVLVTLNPTEIRGEWLVATFQHAQLQPSGHPADTTALYVISARAFDESIGGRR